jgi:PhnB protein
MENQAQPTPPPLSPYLTVHDAGAAIDFYTRAFGAKLVAKNEMPKTSKLMHVHMIFPNGGQLMFSDDFPEMSGGKSRSPKSLGGTGVTLHLDLPDVDATWKQALDAGAEVTMPLADQFWGDRYGKLRDPFSHEWSLATRKQALSPEQQNENARKWAASQ